LERNWTGILIEPIPSFFQKLLTKKRHVFALNACIGGKLPLVAKFRIASSLSVRLSQMTDNLDKSIKMLNLENGGYVYVPCFSLQTVLKALEIENVDYFSLDVEGGEWSVVESLDLTRINIKTFSIEYNWVDESKRKITNHLSSKGYKLTKTDGLDIYFIKN
jgi:hypothetical protein